MPSVNIKYYALLREEARISQEDAEVSCQTYADLYTLLKEKYHFSLPLEMIQVAVNDEFIDLSANITPGARIVFIPPVAGG